MPRTFDLTSDVGGSRLDRFLATSLADLTRSYVKRLIDEGFVTVNGQEVKPSHNLKAGDRIKVLVPEPTATELLPQAMPLSIVYEDADLLVIDKPAGLAVHPGPGHPDSTLVNAVLAHCPDLAGIRGTVRPGIVHRLDKDTSGLIMVAKNDLSQLGLAKQIKDRTITKNYLAVVKGTFKKDEGMIDAPIGRDPCNRKRMAVVATGREARTAYRVLRRMKDHSLIEARLITGRTHQIRVHCASVGHPILGDALYGGRSPLLGRQFLHAAELRFLQPRTGAPIACTSPLPPELQRVLDVLERITAQGQGQQEPGKARPMTRRVDSVEAAPYNDEVRRKTHEPATEAG